MAKQSSSTAPASLPAVGFLRLESVLQIIPLSKSSWHRGVAAGVLPAPVSLGGRAKGYRVADIRALIERINREGLPNFAGGEARA